MHTHNEAADTDDTSYVGSITLSPAFLDDK
jgi:hypothetical protein